MKLRCGVVGLGRGKAFVKAFANIADCEVVAVCDPNPATFEGLSGLKTYRDYDRFLDEKFDIVAIVSPGPVHARQSLAALERGMNVICETPCVYSIEEARAVVKAVEETGLKYMLAENYIWMGWFTAFQEMAAEGKFGEIVYAEGDYTHDCRDIMLIREGGFVPYAERDQHADAVKTWRATDLPPIQYCSHTLGPILRLSDDRVTSAYGLSVMGKVAPDLAPTDLEAALFETEKGAVIRLTNGFTVAHPAAFYYNFVGTRGSAKFFRAGSSTAKYWTELGGKPGEWEELAARFAKRGDGQNDLEAMLAEFVQSVQEDTSPPIDVHESMDMTLPGIIAHQSGLEGGVKLQVPNSRKD
jgi:predicted dehydrogenase